jgi:acyl-CoA thioester hydrolase
MIHFEDLDAMGIVHSGRYVNIFERALAAYWGRAGWSYDPGHPRFAEMLFVVREFTITYHVPISRAGTVQVQLWLERLGTTSLTYGFRVSSDDGTVVQAEGRRVQVRLDPASLRPAPITGASGSRPAPLRDLASIRETSPLPHRPVMARPP